MRDIVQPIEIQAALARLAAIFSEPPMARGAGREAWLREWGHALRGRKIQNPELQAAVEAYLASPEQFFPKPGQIIDLALTIRRLRPPGPGQPVPAGPPPLPIPAEVLGKDRRAILEHFLGPPPAPRPEPERRPRRMRQPGALTQPSDATWDSTVGQVARKLLGGQDDQPPDEPPATE